MGETKGAKAAVVRRAKGAGGAQASGVKATRAKAGAGAAREMTVRRNQRGKDGASAQLRPVRTDGWTAARRKLFIETLAATCNVCESARTVGMNLSGAYHLRRRDPGFAREWSRALSIGYAELEALLMRQSLFGTEEEEIILDSEGAVKSRKVKRGHPLTVAMRLLTSHRQDATAVAALDEVERPDGEDAVQRLRSALDEVRRRTEGVG